MVFVHFFHEVATLMYSFVSDRLQSRKKLFSDVFYRKTLQKDRKTLKHILVFVAMKRKPFEQIFALIEANTACRQEMTETKLATSEIL